MIHIMSNIVEVKRVPVDPLPKQLEFEYVDISALNDISAYFVKVTQEDGEKAWSSPIFVK